SCAVGEGKAEPDTVSEAQAMWNWLVFAAGILTSTARAEPAPVPDAAAIAAGPVETVEDKIEEKQSEAEIKRAARQAEIDEANKAKAARVVVLPWDNEEFWENDNLRRNVSIRIARPDARFYPDIDLYQAGRKEPDKSVRPVDQRAVVPDSAIDELNSAVREVEPIPFNAMAEQEWALKANELRDLAERIWFVDRPELREPLFQLYVQIGKAAENSNAQAPPFFEYIGNYPVNYYWYLAGSMAWETPELLSKVTDAELNSSVNNYRTMLETGQIPLLKLDFTNDSENRFDPTSFADQYTVFFNGVEKTITSERGLEERPPGRVDVYLERDDGHSLSDRIELDKFDEKVYFVRGVARKKMGLSFRDQLLMFPNECVPPVDGDILNYLAIYQRLHPQAEIYIAIANLGSTASNKILLWRWVASQGWLTRVDDNTGGFPVRFALLGGVGITFSTATYETPNDETLTELAESSAVSGTPSPTSILTSADNVSLVPLAFPINIQLRGHYGRLLMMIGQQYSLRLAEDEFGDGGWSDKFQAWNAADGPNTHYDVTDCFEQGGTVDEEPVIADCAVVLRQRTWQRLSYTGLGVVLGRNASIGFGYRGYIRAGWYNAPHLVDLTGHLGVATAPFVKNPDGRVNPVVDLDFWGGAGIPFKDSLFVPQDKKLGNPGLLFGFQVLAGLTF
ncbi:MAG: hypothetical protein H0X18_15225, partial [Geodermatophilaceae bacterium]|nr:hypothetical protein [Geodermatophilaceae bacterium]